MFYTERHGEPGGVRGESIGFRTARKAVLLVNAASTASFYTKECEGRGFKLEIDPEGKCFTIRNVFEVEPIPLHCTRATGYYQNYLRVKKLSQTSVVVIAVHFWCISLPWAVTSSKVDYNALSLNLSSRSKLTNELNSVPRLCQDGIIFRLQLLDSGYRKILRPDQKSTVLLQDIISEFTRLGDMVLNTCCGTIATSRASLLLPQHCRLVGYEKD